MRTAEAINRRDTPESVHHLANFYNVLRDCPGLTAYQVAKRLGRPVSTVYSWLSSLDHIGLLIAEDDLGGLYTC